MGNQEQGLCFESLRGTSDQQLKGRNHTTDTGLFIWQPMVYNMILMEHTHINYILYVHTCMYAYIINCTI